MKIIISKSYSKNKFSQIEGAPQRPSKGEFHDKLQRAIEQVSQGVDTHQAISEQFGDLDAINLEKIKYFVLGSLGKDVSNFSTQQV